MSKDLGRKQELLIYYKDFYNKDLQRILKPIINSHKYSLVACFDRMMSSQDFTNAAKKISIETGVPVDYGMAIDPSIVYYVWSNKGCKELLKNISKKEEYFNSTNTKVIKIFD